MYCHAVRQWLNVVMKGTFDLCYAAWALSGKKSNPKRGRKLRQSRVYLRVLANEHQCFTVLFYRKFRYSSRGPGQVVWTRETGKQEVRSMIRLKGANVR